MKKTLCLIGLFLIMITAFFAGCESNYQEQTTWENQTEAITEKQNVWKPVTETETETEALRVEYISSRNINNYNDYFQFSFQFLDQNEDVIKSEGMVKVRIVNNLGDEVYTATRRITKNDYGTTASGNIKAFFNVYKKDIANTVGGNGRGTFYYQISAADGSIGIMAHHEKSVLALVEGPMRIQTENDEWIEAFFGRSLDMYGRKFVCADSNSRWNMD